MARNKYPEETVIKIIEVASALFMSKGYDNTSIQDIVNHLGMSKGAIYHHFKSKEELLNRITAEYFSNIDWFYTIINDTHLNGLEKLKKIFMFSLGDEEKSTWDKIARPIMNDAKIILEQFHSSMIDVAPMVEKVILEGNADGSLNAPYPRETAELMLVAMNIWLNPSLVTVDRDTFMKKVSYLKFLLEASGLPIIDDNIVRISEKYFQKICAE